MTNSSNGKIKRRENNGGGEWTGVVEGVRKREEHQSVGTLITGHHRTNSLRRGEDSRHERDHILGLNQDSSKK